MITTQVCEVLWACDKYMRRSAIRMLTNFVRGALKFFSAASHLYIMAHQKQNHAKQHVGRPELTTTNGPHVVPLSKGFICLAILLCSFHHCYAQFRNI